MLRTIHGPYLTVIPSVSAQMSRSRTSAWLPLLYSTFTLSMQPGEPAMSMVAEPCGTVCVTELTPRLFRRPASKPSRSRADRSYFESAAGAQERPIGRAGPVRTDGTRPRSGPPGWRFRIGTGSSRPRRQAR